MSEEKTERLKDGKAERPEETPQRKAKEVPTALPPPPKVRENSLPVSALVEREKLSPMLKEALMAAYGWKPDMALTPSEFKRKVETWLKQPAAEGGAK